MLANPVVVPIYADPITWGIAICALCVEVWVVLQLLRRMHQNVKGLDGWLGVLNLVTWIPFLIAVDRLVPSSTAGAIAVIAGLEVAVIAVEAVLLHGLLRGKLFAHGLPCRPIGWRDALRISFLGNLASIAVSIGVPMLLVAILKR